MIVNLPFGNAVEIKDEPHKEEYAYGSRYRFKIVDRFGWDISKAQARDMRINSILGEESDGVLYHMYLSSTKRLETPVVYLDLNGSTLKISGDVINIKFNCKSIFQAEDIIDMILEPNDLEVAPVNIRQ